MKGMFKRALAGVAAAAIAVTGLALGAGAATAAAADPSIVITGATEGSTYTAYRIASYKSAQAVDTDGNQVLDAVTNVDMDTDPTNAGFVSQAIENAGIGPVDATYTDNPAAWLALQDEESLRLFAEVFQNLIDDEDADDPTQSGDSATVAEDATSTTLHPRAEGWYVVTDSQGRAMVVSTGITVKGETSDKDVTYKKLVKLDDEGNVESSQALGTVVAKPKSTPIPEKDPADFTAVGVGDSKKFTITVDVPTLSGYKEYKGFTVTDTASKGLQMPAASAYVVKIGNEALTLNDDYTITPTGGPSTEDGTVTVIKFVDLVATLKNHNLTDDGSLKITIEYTAEITADADDDSVSNQVSVTDPYSSTSGTPVPGETVEIPVGRIEFTKTGVDDPTGLQGATFNVKKGEATLLFTYDAEGGYYMYAGPDAQPSETVKADVVSGAGGKVVIKGLPVDDYTVVETATNTDKGYSNNFLPTFTVTVQNDGGFALVEGSDILGLATAGMGEKAYEIRVLNVKSITQLPVTGAAGITMFVVLGLLIAGAGVTVYMKSRNVKRALRG